MKRRTILALTAVTSLAWPLGASVVAAPGAISTAAAATQQAVRGEQYQVGEPPAPPEPVSATYRVTLDIVWNATTHPTTLPPNSHVSPPVVVTHSAPGNLFAPGTLASPGIEAMAERGSTQTLRNEMNANDLVISTQVGSSIFGAGQQTFTINALQPFDDLVSIVTMLAPSPDWFVGVADVDLFADGAWIDDLTLDLGVYDSGTDSAATFVHTNSDTSPAQVISGPRDAVLVAAADEGRFGLVTFTRLP